MAVPLTLQFILGIALQGCFTVSAVRLAIGWIDILHFHCLLIALNCIRDL